MRRLLVFLIALAIAVPCFGQEGKFVYFKKKAAAGGGGESLTVGSVVESPEQHGTQTTSTWSHTIESGAHRLLVVGFGIADNHSITGVTYNSVAMTNIWSQTSTGNHNTSAWYLAEASLPAAGAYNVVVTFSAANTNGYENNGGSISFTGASATLGDDVHEDSYEDPQSVTGTNVNAADYLVDVEVTGAIRTIGADQTNITNREWGGGGASMSYQSGSAGGVMSWTRTGGAGWGSHGVVVIKPEHP
jgi:hypothetical protein